MPQQAYRLLSDARNSNAKKGSVVYECAFHDYGLSSDDTRALGIECISVTLNRAGGYPFFTIPKKDLEPCETPAIEKLTETHVAQVCRPGVGSDTCRYLCMSGGGWECAKLTTLAYEIDVRVSREETVARGDNCKGRE